MPLVIIDVHWKFVVFFVTGRYVGSEKATDSWHSHPTTVC
jgi:hypothetical protein